MWSLNERGNDWTKQNSEKSLSNFKYWKNKMLIFFKTAKWHPALSVIIIQYILHQIIINTVFEHLNILIKWK